MIVENRYKNELIYNRIIDKDGNTKTSQTIRHIDRYYEKDDVSIYISKEGDTLFSIAEQYYEDFTLWYLISDKNVDLVNPFLVPVGIEIIVPDIEV